MRPALVYNFPQGPHTDDRNFFSLSLASCVRALSPLRLYVPHFLPPQALPYELLAVATASFLCIPDPPPLFIGGALGGVHRSPLAATEIFSDSTFCCIWLG